MELKDNEKDFVSSAGGKAREFERKMLLKKISEMKNLPVPNHHVMKVMLLLRNEEAEMSQIIEGIEKDQSLVAKILQLINSGYYGLRNTIDSVERAVNLLGIMNVKQVIYSATLLELFSDEELEEWNHAHTSSVLMGKLMKENEIPAASNLALTTLMHDIGKVVLRRYSPKKYDIILSHAHSKRLPVHQAEEIVMHIDHAEVGAVLLEKWKMTEDIIKPVSAHHSRDIPAEFVLETALLQFVNWVDCSARGVICEEPAKILMEEAGFEEIDKDYWVNYQKNLIDEIEKSERKNIRDERRHSIKEIKSELGEVEETDTKRLGKTPTGTDTDQLGVKPGTDRIPPAPKKSPVPIEEGKTGTSKIKKPSGPISKQKLKKSSDEDENKSISKRFMDFLKS